MKTNVELAEELEKLIFSAENFMVNLRVLNWHIMKNSSTDPQEKKIRAAFNFLVLPEFDRLSEHELEEETKAIITDMVYKKKEHLLKEFLMK
jgi:hypothetical protein